MMSHQVFEHLDTRDLLAVALRETESVPLDDLLRHHPSLHELSMITVDEIQSATGMEHAAALQLKAILELARRYALYKEPKPDHIRCAADVAALLTPDMACLDREVFKVILLDTKHHIVHVDTVAVGGLASCPIHPREVFKSAIKHSTAAIILAHNHPSGDPDPSPDDLAITRRLVEAGKIIGIDVLDHLIIGKYGYVSLRKRQCID